MPLSTNSSAAIAVQREDSVASPSLEYLRSSEKWQMIHDLMGGTITMRKAGQRWLPRGEKESDAAYNARIMRTFLYNGFSNTVDRLTAKPFCKDVVVEGELPAELGDDFLKNVDKAGTSLTSMTKEVFKSAITYGKTHILVDFPSIPEGASRADELNAKPRPVLIHVTPPQLLGWRSVSGSDGIPELTMVRILECKFEPSGDWIDQEVEYIRVYTKTEWIVFRKVKDDEKADFAEVARGQHTFGMVPFFTVYTNQVGYLSAEPPLEDLAWINIEHWGSSSQQNTALAVARTGILFAKGFEKDEVDQGFVIGPNHVISTENVQATLEVVEHSGQAIGAGQMHIDRCEQRMEVLGLKPLVERTSNATATGKLLDEMSTHTSMQTWVRSIEHFLWEVVNAACKWVQVELDEALKFNIFSDFGITTADSVHLDALLKGCIANKISDKTFLNEYKRRAVINENVDVDEELVRTKAQREEAAKLKASEKPAVVPAQGASSGAV